MNNIWVNQQIKSANILSDSEISNALNSSNAPSQGNISQRISDSNVKSIFNKFFTNSGGAGSGTSFSSWPPSGNNNNAFAYMRSNGVEGRYWPV